MLRDATRLSVPSLTVPDGNPTGGLERVATAADGRNPLVRSDSGVRIAADLGAGGRGQLHGRLQGRRVAALAERLQGEGAHDEVVVGWEATEANDREGRYGYGYDHSYCLVFAA